MTVQQLRRLQDKALLFKFAETDDDRVNMAELDKVIAEEIEAYCDQRELEKLGGPKAVQPFWLQVTRGIA